MTHSLAKAFTGRICNTTFILCAVSVMQMIYYPSDTMFMHQKKITRSDSDKDVVVRLKYSIKYSINILSA